MAVKSCHCERGKASEAIPNNEIASSFRQNVGLPRNDNIIKIRAHHLLCMQNFKGHGYNQDFVNNMGNIIKEINSPPNLELEIISKCDVICSHCPHNKGNICKKKPSSAQELKNMDIQVLKDLDLTEGVKIKAKEIISLVKKKLLKDASYIKNTCKNCEWKEMCIEAFSYENL